MDLCERTSNTIRHPWETTRARMILKLLAREVPDETPLRVLDVGCGDGYFLKLVKEKFPRASIDGVDLNIDTAVKEDLSRHGIGTARDIRDLKGPYDVIFLLDVIEHLNDDASLLEQLVKGYAGKGCLFIITVPAHPALFSSQDRFLRHYRRYQRHTFLRLVRNAGLNIDQDGTMFASLLFPRLASCLAEKFLCLQPRQHAGLGQWRHGAFLTMMVEALLDVDNNFLFIVRRMGLALPGLSLWAFARKNT